MVDVIEFDPIKYEFGQGGLFPPEYENEQNILFHGTSEQNAASILANSFERTGMYDFTSFAQKSIESLPYACNKRIHRGRGAILSVRFKDLSSTALRKVNEIYYLEKYDPEHQPTFLAICYIPHDYDFRKKTIKNQILINQYRNIS